MTRTVFEACAVIILCLTAAVTLLWLVMPVNEYSWIAGEGSPVPVDCDIDFGLVLVPAGPIFLIGTLGFGVSIRKRRTGLRVIGLLVSSVMLVGVGLKMPSYLSETARAAQHCQQ